MNKNQRLIVIGAVGFFLLLNLFPPWLVPYGTGNETIRSWSLLFNPPSQSGAVSIDWLILGFEWLVAVIAASILVWLFRQGH